MAILVVTWNFPPRKGGIESLIKNLCDGLGKNHQVFVITAHACSTQPSDTRVFRPVLPGLLPFAVFVLWRGTQLLRQNPAIKLVFGGSAIVAPLVLILARLFGRTAATQTHGLDLLYPNLFYQFLCVRWIGWCDRVIANSSYTASLAKTKGAADDRISVIPPGVDWRKLSAPISAATAGHFNFGGKKVILFVGRLTKRKGVVPFIEKSLPAIIERVPNACLVVVGDNPTESLTDRRGALEEIRLTVTALKLEKHVQLLGAVSDDDLIALYRLCELVILPALPLDDDIEGFGIVLLEAAAAGKPAVGTRVGGIPDAVDDGESGILVDAGDYSGLSRSVIELLQNAQRRRAMGEYARRRIEERFSWERITASYEAVLGL